jgi:hypothetical protein
MSKILTLVFTFLFTMLCYASDVPVEAMPGESVFEFLMKLLASAEGASIGIALVLELVLRAFPTKKPMSILLAVAYIAEKSGAFLSGFAKFLNKILPQNVKG